MMFSNFWADTKNEKKANIKLCHTLTQNLGEKNKAITIPKFNFNSNQIKNHCERRTSRTCGTYDLLILP